MDEVSFRSTPEVWGYFSVKAGGAIHEFSDSQVRGALRFLNVHAPLQQFAASNMGS